MLKKMRASRRTGAVMESLEGRQLFNATLGTNLVLNPGAESNTGVSNTTSVVTPSNWTANGHPTTAKYGTVGAFPTTSSPGHAGSEFFAGGPTDPESDLFQTISLFNLSSSVDAKKVDFSLSGFLGGSSNQGDNVTLFANFSDAGMGLLGQVFVGPVTASNRGNVTELLSRSTSGVLPVGTRYIQIQLHFQRSSGTYDDGYADSISMVLSTPPTTGTVSGVIFKDANGNGKQDSGEAGLSGWMAYIDANNNGQYDPGETYVITSSTGAYTFTLKPGKYEIRAQVRSGYYESHPSALEYTVNVTAGGKTTGELFGMKPIAAV